ncbi:MULTISPECIES: bifunctional 2-C-methyl-D-erythritol 4-phosphate cytidylyltransferase/2-C-methyl-D-erythritol 2,4-cyclodiphosphate synthase [unclassified Helicobacter]|uniref:bifunctional 2-C-methyl-D-erythritol 4-phosphate cytidylyltransferase/2-C-methyl-D-erythritol 2,4-cyclodiphosphate synthase n=1 Tax=unclassified Helicobacter TaxID=2593540 RepID=UPI000CF1714A|nr:MULTISPECIES: bifunctional 2-C-methyl-D-erythritol 4-phosphate cytidylyltransferase/2-C-methyl-D-erythritol 2,4-cyclodiphosphate synthase [unclassified Helicobacter]
MKTPTLCLILMAAGSSSRFNQSLPPNKKIKKQWLRIGETPLWKKVLIELKKLYDFDEIIIGADSYEVGYMQKFCDQEKVIAGGNTRAQTLRNALEFVKSDFVFVTDVARCNLDIKVCQDLLKCYKDYDCTAPYIDCVDTILYQNNTINRSEVKLIQTPQISHTQKLKQALQKKDYTDESTAMLDNNHQVHLLQGSNKMQKLTTLQDLKLLTSLTAPKTSSFSGGGIDIHQFEQNKPMKLGGIEITQEFGFKAHSDGDVLLHSIIDALLGAVGGGDIGEWFPDNDENFKNIDSKILLKKVRDFIISIGYEIIHLDVNIVAQKPKITPYKQALIENIASLLYLPKHHINLKATTAEKMGFIGREEGICVLTNATLKFLNWKEWIDDESFNY